MISNRLENHRTIKNPFGINWYIFSTKQKQKEKRK